jgi:hypothetical protein
MKEKRTITLEKFKDVARFAWSEYMDVDLTDYYQWQGFNDFLRYFWLQFDSRRKYSGEKQGFLTAKTKYKNAIHAKYKKLFWKFYFRIEL